MSQHLSFSQAARLLGVSRHQLQQQVRSGELPCMDGKIDVEELRKRYPTLEVNDSSMIERVREIKDHAFARRVASAAYPEPEVMAGQIKRLRAELALERGKAKKYQDLVEALITRVNLLLCDDGPMDSEAVESMWAWLREEVTKPHKPC